MHTVIVIVMVIGSSFSVSCCRRGLFLKFEMKMILLFNLVTVLLFLCSPYYFLAKVRLVKRS